MSSSRAAVSPPLTRVVKVDLTGPDRIHQVNAIAEAMDGSTAEQILAWALETFGTKLGFMTQLGYSGIVLMDHLRRLVPRIEAHFIDTGFHFPETIELLHRLADLWSIDFKILRPPLPDEQLEALVGRETWKTNPDLCCHYRKVDPMLRVLHTKDAWLSGLRRDQSVTREQIDVVEIDGRGVLKVYPLAAWSSEQCWEYIQREKLPYNVLHDEGYLSLGCTHCTAPVTPGEHERVGRWNSMPKMECGIHVHTRRSTRR